MTDKWHHYNDMHVFLLGVLWCDLLVADESLVNWWYRHIQNKTKNTARSIFCGCTIAGKFHGDGLVYEYLFANVEVMVFIVTVYRIPFLTGSGPLFTKCWDVLPPNPVKSQNHEVGCYNVRIALKFDRHRGSAAADVPVKFHSNQKGLNPTPAVLILDEILR